MHWFRLLVLVLCWPQGVIQRVFNGMTSCHAQRLLAPLLLLASFTNHFSSKLGPCALYLLKMASIGALAQHGGYRGTRWHNVDVFFCNIAVVVDAIRQILKVQVCLNGWVWYNVSPVSSK